MTLTLKWQNQLAPVCEPHCKTIPPENGKYLHVLDGINISADKKKLVFVASMGPKQDC